jgi:hypothetical protein
MDTSLNKVPNDSIYSVIHGKANNIVDATLYDDRVIERGTVQDGQLVADWVWKDAYDGHSSITIQIIPAY